LKEIVLVKDLMLSFYSVAVADKLYLHPLFQTFHDAGESLE